MAIGTSANEPDERAIRALLDRYDCPAPWHEVRTRFLGSIASLVPEVSPLGAVAGLWGGKLPAFASVDDAEALLGALLHGLWNDLTRHQQRRHPFRLTRLATDPSAENLSRYGRVRLQELSGFVEGLFGGQNAVDLPERAHFAVRSINELRSMMRGVAELGARGFDNGDRAEIAATLQRLEHATAVIETEIHEAILSCARARQNLPADIDSTSATRH
jgi:hypothetical protein